MARIDELIIGDDHLITVLFTNGHSVTIDMKKKLHTVRFSELRDEQIFKAAKTDGKVVQWPGGISVSVSEIVELFTQ